MTLRGLLATLTCALVLAALGCNSSRGSSSPATLPPGASSAPTGPYFATAAPGSHSYTLSVAQGAAVSGPAIYAGGVPTSCLLVVEVRDEHGALADDVKVWFRSVPAHTVMALGESMSGWPLQPFYSGEHGRAPMIAQPYLLGTVPVIAEVDPGNGSSNQVTFFVTGF